MSRRAAIAISAIALIAGFAAGMQVAHGQAPGTFGRKVHHVNMIVRDADKTVQALAEVWGLAVPKVDTCSATSSMLCTVNDVPFPPDGKPGGNIRYARMKIDNLWLEVIQPLGQTPSPWRDHLEKHGEGLHHIGVEAANTRETVRYLQAKGGKWTLGAPTGDFAYVDMRPRLPFTIEVVGPEAR